ncbi:EXS-domain-containing protein [Lentinus tigrinus ALCF2SS1-7]|uniref:EXS-domain-containing protein n=1 Tax=Lentinus tigrinus ALCF2SS1-7 TaxID=1328758 RepID=UPI0011663044|nr:EXS-domain-containing protein [Lentinus tigrinus ALCF2SS1-7]
MKSDFLDELYFSSAFPLPFRVLCLVGLGILGWATNLHGLHLWHIDAAGVLDLNNYDGYRLTSPLPTDRRAGWKGAHYSLQAHRPVYKLFVTYFVWTFACWLVFRYATRGDIESVDSFKFIPALASLCVLTALMCPFNVLYKHERDKFLAAIHRCLLPSPHRVYFSDVVFADIFTSFAKVLGDMWLSVYMLLPSGSLLAQPAQDGLTRWILPTLMSIPYAVRLRQCLVEYNAPNNESRRPLFNALKYASSFPVIFLSAAQRIVVSDTLALKGESAVSQPWHGEHQLFRLWLLAAAVNSLYSFWWDVTNDWGLDLLLPKHAGGPSRQSSPPRPLILPRLHSRSALLKNPGRTSVDSNPDGGSDDVAHTHAHAYALPQERPLHLWGLRPVLLFPLAVYPFAILVDLVLRLTWSAKLSSHLHSYAEGDLIIFWIELAEVVRRWMWVFLRVEWETIKEAQVHESASRSPPRSAVGMGMGAGAGAGGIAMERRETFREPVHEQEEFEMVPSDISGHNSEAG